MLSLLGLRRPGLPRSSGSAFLFVAVGAAVGCWSPDSSTETDVAVVAAGEGQHSVVDDAGISHSVATTRRRVVSTLPGITDLFVALGAKDQLVGRTRYDVGPEVAHLTSVGGGLDPDLETLTVLEPDLVILWADTDARSMASRIRDLGMDAYSAKVDDMASFRRHARQIGRLAGLEAEVDSLLASADLTLSHVQEQLKGAPKPTVLYVIGVDPPMIAGPGTFLDSLVTASGGTNVFSDLEVAWPQISLEAIVERDPDFVVVSVQSGSSPPLSARRDGWAQVGAVRRGRVIEVDPNLFNRPGPHVGTAALTLARSLHPERTLAGRQ